MQKQRIPRYPRQKRSAFSLIPLLPHVILIAIVIGVYYYLFTNNLFFNYLDYIYIGVKCFILLDIFIASIGTILAPILSLIAGVVLLYLGQDYSFDIYSPAWELIIMAGIGFVIRFLVR